MNGNKPYALWWRWVVIIGIVQDWVIGIPGIFIPNTVLGALGQSVAQPVWPAFASMLVFLLSLFYIPGALDPFRYSATAVLTVVARGAGVVFFFLIWPGAAPAFFGYIDLTFTILQGVLLWLTFRQGQTVVSPPPGQQATA
jgi:hypothetical protein